MGKDKAESYDLEYERQMRSLGRLVSRIDGIMREDDENRMKILELRIQGPHVRGEGFLATIKARTDDGRPYIGWRGGETLEALLMSIRSGIEENTVKWRDDEPWTPAKAKAAAKTRTKG